MPMEEGKSTQQILESLNQRIQVLGGVKSGTHEIDCDVYQSCVPMGKKCSHQACMRTVGL